MEKCPYREQVIVLALNNAAGLHRDGIVNMSALGSARCENTGCSFIAIASCPSGVVTEINQCGEESKSPQESSKIIT